jgi:hypothetical protein
LETTCAIALRTNHQTCADRVRQAGIFAAKREFADQARLFRDRKGIDGATGIHIVAIERNDIQVSTRNPYHRILRRIGKTAAERQMIESAASMAPSVDSK